MAEKVFKVPLKKLVEHFKLEAINEPENIEKIKIKSCDIFRPGIQLAVDFFDHFDNTRIQLFGKVEMAYLASLSGEKRLATLKNLFSHNVPAVIITRGLEVYPEFIEAAKEYDIPLYRTGSGSSGFMSALIAWLNVELAPRITRHGVLVEVYGEGVLILGESGVGKSEAAVELLKRGH